MHGAPSVPSGTAIVTSPRSASYVSWQRGTARCGADVADRRPAGRTRRTAIDSYPLSAGPTAANPPYSNRLISPVSRAHSSKPAVQQSTHISCQPGPQQQTRRTAIDSYPLSAGPTATNPPYSNRLISPVSRAHSSKPAVQQSTHIRCQPGPQQQTRRTAIDSYPLSAGPTAANQPYSNRLISAVSRYSD